MKRAAAAILVILLISALFAGCERVVKGSGKLETRQFDFNDFERVDISSAFRYEIAQSGSYNVSITANDNMFEHMRISQEGETLRIGLKALTFGDATLRAAITMPQLRKLDISGASHGTVSGFRSKEGLDIDVSGASSVELIGMSFGDMRCDISGASKVTGNIEAGNADCELSGASSIQLEGSANDIAIDASGASRVKLAALPVNNAEIKLSGASTGTVNMEGRLDADLSGASKFEYLGEPSMGNIKTSGASTVSRQKIVK